MNYSTHRLIAVLSLCVSPLIASHLRADQSWAGTPADGTTTPPTPASSDGRWFYGDPLDSSSGLDPVTTDFSLYPMAWDNGTAYWQTNGQVAYFKTNPGTVTVDDSAGQVGANQLNFSSSSTAAWTIAGPQGIDISIQNVSSNDIIVNNGNGNVTISAPIMVDTATPTDRYTVYNNANTMTLGDVTFNGAGPVSDSPYGRSFIIHSGTPGSTVNLNGTYSDSSATGGIGIGIRLGEGNPNSTDYLNGNFAGLSKGIAIGSGNIIVNPGAVLGTQTIGMYDDGGDPTQNTELLTANSATISNDVYLSAKYDNNGTTQGRITVGGSDATVTQYSGNIGLDATDLAVKATTGGRVTFSGVINNQSPDGVSKIGGGTVVFSNSNTYGTYDKNNVLGSTAMDVQAGTLLITNTAGSAFGSNNSAIVKVENLTTLGGSGISSQKVVAVGPMSVIAPGDAGTDGGTATIATLHLQGGLTASTGLTMDFKLVAPGTSDALDLGAGAFTLAGPVTVNLTAFAGTVASGTYELASGTGAWDGSGATFTFVPPTGDTVTGYNFNQNGNDQFNVTIAAPEPSTYALMLAGVVGLGFIVRRKGMKFSV